MLPGGFVVTRGQPGPRRQMRRRGELHLKPDRPLTRPAARTPCLGSPDHGCKPRPSAHQREHDRHAGRARHGGSRPWCVLGSRRRCRRRCATPRPSIHAARLATTRRFRTARAMRRCASRLLNFDDSAPSRSTRMH
jgi:hypothetical protein